MEINERVDSMTRANKSSNKTSDQIDDNLRRVYEDALSQQVPERFMELIEQLRQSDKTAGKVERDDT